MDLYIYGSGSIGCEIVDTLQRSRKSHSKWKKFYFIDDFRIEKLHYGLQIFRFNEILRKTEEFECIIAIGEPFFRRKIYEKLIENKIKLATIIDDSAIISPTATIEQGCIIGPHSFISSNTIVSENSMIEIQTIIGHDIKIGKHSVISSCSVIGGGTHIGNESFIGLNSTIKEKIRIGNESIIGMGSSVFNDIGNELIAVGNPARPVRKNENRLIFKS